MRRGGLFPSLYLVSPCCLAALALLACASTGSFAALDDAAARNHYAASSELLEKNKKKLYPARDAVRYYLDKGMLCHYAEQYADSAKLLEAGERAIESAFTKSVTQEAGTFLLNDNVREYAGEDYEDIYLNAFNALNYYHRKNLDEALVEIRRMNNKLAYLADKYGAELSALQKKALEEHLEGIPANPNAAGQFADSALARYLGMLFYRGAGMYDDARIDRDWLRAAFANAPQVYAYPLPASIAGELAVPAGMARLNVLAFGGLSPYKREEVLRIPLPNDRWVKIALPELVSRHSEIARIELALDSGGRFNLELLEDIDAVARETFKTRRQLVYLKTIIRAMVKGVSSSVFDAAANEASGEAQLVFGLLSLSAQIFAEASEQADIRLSRYFPASAWVGGINLPPGVYSFHVNYLNRQGKRLASLRYENIAVTENALNLVEAFCIK
jgi:hypothetical protein